MFKIMLMRCVNILYYVCANKNAEIKYAVDHS